MAAAWLAFWLATAGMHCDLPGANLSSSPLPDAATCAAACEAEPKCRAWTFVSGWNRCFLKAAATKPVSLQIHAAHVEADGRGHRRLGAVQRDHDDSGKDLRRVSGVASAERCGELCLAEAQCRAIAFLEGYGDCWLKRSAGQLRPKTFSCGAKTKR